MRKPSRTALLRHFPNSGPCLICGCKTLGAMHRLIDTIRSRYRKGGESIARLARDYKTPRAVIAYVVTAPLRELDFLRRMK